MNIFILDTSPAIAASYHCDQHLHKMILESAQMLSTAMVDWYPAVASYIYKPAHPNHPCTLWIKQSKRNAWWVADLMWELNELREIQGSDTHSSMIIRKIFMDNLDIDYDKPDPFIFAGPLQYKLRPDLSITQKYQEYYKLKYKLWLDTKQRMSYSNRSLPAFLTEFKDTIPHD